MLIHGSGNGQHELRNKKHYHGQNGTDGLDQQAGHGHTNRLAAKCDQSEDAVMPPVSKATKRSTGWCQSHLNPSPISAHKCMGTASRSSWNFVRMKKSESIETR